MDSYQKLRKRSFFTVITFENKGVRCAKPSRNKTETFKIVRRELLFAMQHKRKPKFLLRLLGLLLFRLPTEQFLALLFQLPPRLTRLEPDKAPNFFSLYIHTNQNYGAPKTLQVLTTTKLMRFIHFISNYTSIPSYLLTKYRKGYTNI